MTREEIQKTLAAIRLIYPNLQVIQPTIDLWFKVLSNENYSDIEAATVQYFSKANDFPPTPGHLIDLAKEARRLRSPRFKEIDIPRNAAKGSLRDMLTPEGLEKLLKLTGENKNA